MTSFDGTTDYDYFADGQLSSVDYDFANSAAIPPDDEEAYGEITVRRAKGGDFQWV